MAEIDGMILKDRQIVLLKELQKQVMSHLLNNDMGVEKMRPLACKSIYWVGRNTDIETYPYKKLFNMS